MDIPWSKIKKTRTCWLWGNNKRYGRYEKNGKRYIAHRFVYEALVGKIPKGFELDHLCRNPPCVNPKHLEPVTPRENKLRGIGVGAMAIKRTHCPKGHSLEGKDIWRQPKVVRLTGEVVFWRGCRMCRRAAHRNWKDRLRSKGCSKTQKKCICGRTFTSSGIGRHKVYGHCL